MARRSLPRALARQARTVTARRLRHGPRQPGWEWAHEVFQAFLRDEFSRKGADPRKVRRTMDAAGKLSPDAVRVRLIPGRPAGVPSVILVPPRATDRFILYLHGGGYVFGSPTSHLPLLAALARRSRARILAVDYRLAPEHPCPAAIEDVVAVWRWWLGRGVDPSAVTIMGDSAGGGLVLTSMLAMRDADLPLPGRAALLSPWTDLAVTGESARRNHVHDYLGHGDELYEYAAHYAGGLDRRDPRISPLYAPDLSALPPTLVLAGGVETILDDSVRIAARLRDHGVDASLHVEPHEVHVYPMFSAVSRRGRRGVHQLSAWVHGEG